MRTSWRRSITAVLSCLTLSIPLVALTAGPATAAELPSIRVNEVVQNGDTSDWVELTNTGSAPVDVSGWILKDDKDDRALALAAGSTIEPGGFLTVDVDGDEQGAAGFGLGRADTIRVYLADAVTLVDSYAWSDHSATSFGRCPDGTGEFRLTAARSKAAANICEANPAEVLRINEVESNGDATDWIELINIGTAPVDASGLVIKDDDDARTATIPAGTVVAPGGFLMVAPPILDYGLGGADSARLFGTDGVTLIDAYAWTAHAATTFGRCPDGVGAFAETAASTAGAANDCVAGETPAIVVNEVESSGGTPGDWIELFNAGSSAVDLSGFMVRDSDDSHVSVLPAGSTITAGGYFVVEEGQLGYGLGAADTAKLYLPGGFTLVDERSWTTHASTSYGLCGADFVTTTSTTKGAVNDCGSPVRINEIESNDGTPGDWVELKNNGSTVVDASGFSIRDSDDSHVFTLPAGSTIAAGGYLIADVDGAGGFGLGKADSVRLFGTDGTTIVDSYEWTAHAAASYGRCPDGTGDFASTTAVTRGASNACAGDKLTAAWPGSAAVSTADAANVLGGNMSGLAVEETTEGDVLWAAKNGTGMLHRLIVSATASGISVAPDSADGWGAGKPLHYPDGTGDVDAEGIALTDAGAAGGVFVSSERNNDASGVSRLSVLRFDVSAPGESLSATTEWNLTADLPAVGANAGLEAIAWVPDEFLVAGGLIDESTGLNYAPSVYPNHGTGLFFVGVEAGGMIYAYALEQQGGFTRVASFASGFTGVMDLEFDAERAGLIAVCDDTCDGQSALLTLAPDPAARAASGRFEVAAVYERPAGMPNVNNEGFALASAAQCVDGSKPAYWADDNNTDGHAIRVGAINCVAAVDPIDPIDPGTPVEPGTPVDPAGPNGSVKPGSSSALADTGVETAGVLGLALLAALAGGALVFGRRRAAQR